MCGRFTQQKDTAAVVERFDVQHTLFEATPRYNVAPSQFVAVVVRDARQHERYLDGFQWGLIPFWAKEPSISSKLINARAETVAEKPAFRQALRQRRCLIPADGFYEWDKISGTRQPFHFRRSDSELFAFAGLWEEWIDKEGSPVRSCTIITTQANVVVGEKHDRMPVILQNRDDENLWLDDRVQRTGDLLPLLRPLPDDFLQAIPVSRRVNRPNLDVPDLVEEALEASGPIINSA